MLVGVLVVQPNLPTGVDCMSLEKNNDTDGYDGDDLTVRKFDIRPSESSMIYFPDDENYKRVLNRIGNN